MFSKSLAVLALCSATLLTNGSAGGLEGVGTPTDMDVALEGALTANNPTPSVGDSIYLYFNVTPLERVESLTLRFELPDGVASLGKGPNFRSFAEVNADQTRTLSLAVKIMEPGEKTFYAAAVQFDELGLSVSRTFVLALEPKS